MSFDSLSDAEKALVGQALRAAARGPFFPDHEFLALFGFERNEFCVIADAWPAVVADREDMALAITESVFHLLYYPHRKQAIWSDWISVDRPQLGELYETLRGSGFLDDGWGSIWSSIRK